MSLKVPNVGELVLLDKLLAADDYTLHLYKNNYTPVDGSVIGDFTEADFSGYSGGEDITGWSAAVIVAGRAESTGDPIDQTHNGGATGNTIYGFYVVDSGGNLCWAERDPNPFVINANGQIYRVEPKFTGVTEF